MIHKRITIGSFLVSCILIVASCTSSEDSTATPANEPPSTSTVKILTLGDSYTIGESVSKAQNFPHQLKTKLEENNAFKVDELKIVAKTGWTTSNLLNVLEVNPIKDTFDLVTLLIGVNNQFQKLPIQDYETEFLTLLQKAIGYAGNNKSKVIVLSIPDYGATPFGQGSAAVIGKEIDLYNSINKNLTDIAGVSYINITPISRKGTTDKTLVANDGLHPSAKMYSLWVNAMFPSVIEKLK